jgi:hypothetical protein
MNLRQSKKHRRLWVTLNYAALVGFVIIWFFILAGHKNVLSYSFGAISLIVVLISFYFAYLKTRIWNLVHTSVLKLDEREISVIYYALRYAYSIFAILCLIIMIAISLSKKPIDIMTVAVLIYLAHILPASIIAWKEKEV